MEFELGLKITRDADDQNSTDFHIAKDRTGPIFISTETDSAFILSAHLKGFEEENIKININEDGTRITISGEKMVSEMIMSGWRVYKKEKEVKWFKKTFKIPDGVVLDRIRAKFGAENFSLTIYMPKSEKGTRGHGIEEVEEEEKDGEKPTRRSENTTDQKGQEKEKIMKPDADVEDLASKMTPGVQGGANEHENGEAAKHQKERGENSMQKEGEGAVVEKKPGFFAPSFFMGSALIASLVMLVVGLVRTNSTKRK